MKRIISVLLVFVILCSTFSGLQVTSHALSSSGNCGANVNYTFNMGFIWISGNGYMYNYSSYSSPFYAQKSIRRVTIDNGINNIGSYSFFGCSNLTSVTIPDSVTSIGEGAFAQCNALTNIDIPNSIKSIGEGAFYYCQSLKSITIPDTVTKIEDNAFYGCPGLKIYGSYGSAAHSYAKKYGVTFIGPEHEHHYTSQITRQSTCKTAGEKTFTCSVCGDYYTESLPLSTIHNYVATVTRQATCTQTGTRKYTCSVCSTYYTETIPKTAHSYVSDNIITKASQGSDGQIVKIKCSYCGLINSSETIYAPNEIVLSTNTYTYSGKANKPAVTVKDSIGSVIDSSNYTVAYSNNINAGTAKVTVTFKGDMYEGSMSKTFKISPKKLTTCGLRTVHTYSGKAIVPTPYYYKTVKEWNPYFKEYDIYKKITAFRKNVDYTIAVSGGHKNIGTYTVVIKFKGNYSGTIKKTMQIRPKPVVSSKPIIYSTTSIKVSWSKVKNVSGYVVYRYNNNNNKWVKYKNTTKNSIILPRVLKSDLDVIYCIKTYKKVGKKVYWNDSNNSHINWQYTKPNKPTVKLVNKDFGEFLIKFDRIADHQTQLSDNKAFSNKGNNICVTYRKYASDEVRASQWGSARTYYVRSREFYYSKSGNLVVGPWSDVKKITTL